MPRMRPNERDFSAGRAARAQGQAPIAAILSCADSRVAPELEQHERRAQPENLARDIGRAPARTRRIGEPAASAAIVPGPARAPGAAGRRITPSGASRAQRASPSQEPFSSRRGDGICVVVRSRLRPIAVQFPRGVWRVCWFGQPPSEFPFPPCVSPHTWHIEFLFGPMLSLGVWIIVWLAANLLFHMDFHVARRSVAQSIEVSRSCALCSTKWKIPRVPTPALAGASCFD